MRISWNIPMNGDVGMMCLTIVPENSSISLKEDMTPDMIRRYAEEMHEIANHVEKRIKRYETLMLIERHVREGEKINAIRELRTLANISLLDAKDIIEMMSAFKNGRRF